MITIITVLLTIIVILLIVDRIRVARRHNQVREELARGIDAFENELVAQLTTQTIPKRVMEHLRTTLASQSEQFAAFSGSFSYDPKDARFLGSPIDFVVFNGRSNGTVEDVVFIEVKQHKGVRLTPAEASLKDAVDSGRVRWERLDLSETQGITTDTVRTIGAEELTLDVNRSVREKTRAARDRLIRITKGL